MLRAGWLWRFLLPGGITASAVGDVTISAVSEDETAIPARISIKQANGHPVVNPAGASYLNLAKWRALFLFRWNTEPAVFPWAITGRS